MAIATFVAGAAVAGEASVARLVGRLGGGRPTWLLVGVGLELVSVLGFVATFQLVFGAWLPRGMGVRAGLAVRAATILVPAGGLFAISAGAKALRRGGMPRAQAAPSMIAFLLLTNAPNLIALGVFGLALGGRLLPGPSTPILTIVPAVIAFGVVGAAILLPAVSHQRTAPRAENVVHRKLSAVVGRLESGVIEALRLLSHPSWRLLGAVAYYAADNATLWAAFAAFGRAHPPLATFAMAYLIGSTAAALPVPGGIGVVEGGIIGSLVLYGAPALCATVAVLAYRAFSTGLPLALGAVASLGLLRARPPATSSSRTMDRRIASSAITSTGIPSLARRRSARPRTAGTPT